MDYKKYADMLYEAERDRRQIDRLTDLEPGMTVADAYRIQLHNANRRLSDGEKLIGMKIGLTSSGMQKLLNVDKPDFGHLFSNMLIEEGHTVDTSSLIQPKVEGELTFCIGRELKGPGITAADVFTATDYVTPSIEIVDSRIKDWKIKLQDTIADNGSSARFVLGGRMRPVGKVDMRLTGMTLEKNGELVNSGTAAEVWGSPAAAVACLANMLSEYEMALPAGSLVMAGAFTAALEAHAGDVFTASFTNMGAVTIRFS